MTNKINNLAKGIGIEMDLGALLPLKNLRPIQRSAVDSGHSVAMRGVGIVLGRVGDVRPAPRAARRGWPVRIENRAA
jgi:hypothetical protein